MNSALSENTKNRILALEILSGKMILTEALDLAYKERFKYFGDKVMIHILDNIKNGNCSENCGYCAQRKDANSGVMSYPMRSEEEIIQHAIDAKKNGVFRFCMVASGTGPGDKFTEKLAGLINKITHEVGIKVCLSAGFIDKEKAHLLKNSGLDRYNHNLNTSKNNYPKICDTHTYEDRLINLSVIAEAGIGICSGVIVGMGETDDELIEVALELKKASADSIPVNFFIPIEGHKVNATNLTPEKCLRILCMFRILNPSTEIRIAAGREGHLRGLQSMALYAANSLFAEGYLNVKGSDLHETVNMIFDAGFFPESNEQFDIKNNQHLYSEKNMPSMYKYKFSREGKSNV